MRGKAMLLLLLGAAIGYVLGTRDGRERYEQVKSAARMWAGPLVQQVQGNLQARARDFASQEKELVGRTIGDVRASNPPGPDTLPPPPPESDLP